MTTIIIIGSFSWRKVLDVQHTAAVTICYDAQNVKVDPIAYLQMMFSSGSMNAENNKGPRTEPGGTPQVRVTAVNMWPCHKIFPHFFVQLLERKDQSMCEVLLGVDWSQYMFDCQEGSRMTAEHSQPVCVQR